MKNIIQISILAGVMGLCYACSGSENELHEVTQEVQASRGTDVEATADLETAGTLETILKDAHGDEVANITKLTIAGPFNAVDRNFLCENLKSLHTLNMKGATIVADSIAENNKYSIGAWYTYYLEDNTVSYRMFDGLSALKSLVLPDNLLTIDSYGLAYLSIENIELPASVTSLGSYAFYQCKGLSEVKLNEGIASIPEYCFSQCEKLAKIELPASVTSLGRYAFYQCKGLSEVKLNEGMASIPECCFYECEKLAKIELPASVTSLGSSAFCLCKELSEVKLNEGITVIPASCFSQCEKLAKIELPASVEKLENGAFYYCAFDDFTPFQNIPSLGDYVFEGCKFKSLKLTDAIVELGSEVFSYNKDLTTVEYMCGSSVPYGTFEACSSLSSVTLASSVTSVGSYAFRSCQSLTDYAPFSNITSIGSYAFYYCGFTDLNLPEGVTYIGEYAFYNLPINNLTLPSTLTEIGNSAFNNCLNLTTITVPASVTTVGGMFFDRCTALTSVFWNAAVDVPGISTSSWYDDYISPNILLYINNENIKVDASWKNLIVNGVAQNITINSQERFHCPQEFTAKNISYSRNFSLSTSIGGNEGWETIVLPFVPTAYAHESKGVIAPFDSETDTKKHFWLRSLTTEGFADVTAMEANKPYIISMPYSYDYADEYNLNGKVTFSATDVTVGVTPETLESVAGPGFGLQPVYAPKETSVSIYALNVRTYLDSYSRGSVFAHSLDDTVQPFEAYAFLTEAKSSRTRVIGVGDNIGKSRSAVKPNTSGIPQKEDMRY